MVESVIMMLIYLCLLVGVIYLVIFVLGRLGIEIPPPIMNIIWVIVLLVALLILWQTFGGRIRGIG
jgi:hypothetical protein